MLTLLFLTLWWSMHWASSQPLTASGLRLNNDTETLWAMEG